MRFGARCDSLACADLSTAPDGIAHLAELGRVLELIREATRSQWNWPKERDFCEVGLERWAMLQTHSGTDGRRRVLQRKLERHRSGRGDPFYRAYQGGLPGLGRRR